MGFLLLKISLFFHTHSHFHTFPVHISCQVLKVFSPYRSALRVCPPLSFWDLSSLPMMKVLFTYSTCLLLMTEVWSCLLDSMLTQETTLSIWRNYKGLGIWTSTFAQNLCIVSSLIMHWPLGQLSSLLDPIPLMYGVTLDELELQFPESPSLCDLP